MDPLSVAIGVGGNLLGGLLGNRNNRRAIAEQNEYNKPINIRKRAEEGGFNPLLFVGPGVGNQTSVFADQMGASIADASMFAADAMVASSEDKLLIEEQNEHIAKLSEQLQRVTLRPSVPGIFGSREGAAGTGGVAETPTVPAVPSDPVGSGGEPLLYNLGDEDITSSSDDASRVPVKPLYFAGNPLDPRSGFSDAEAFGSRYGEDFLSPGWFAGWGGLIGDVALSLPPYLKRKAREGAAALASDRERWRRGERALRERLGEDWWLAVPDPGQVGETFD